MSTETNESKKAERKIFRQSDLPKATLQEAITVAQALWDQFAGKETNPIFVAQALNISPTSSNWRTLSGASVAYGLITGGYNSKVIGLTDLGKRVVAPTSEDDDKLAIFEAAQIPTFFKRFYNQYGNGNKLPSDKIAENILISWGIPQKDASATFLIIKQNGEFANIIISIKGNQYVQLTPNFATNSTNGENVSNSEAVSVSKTEPDELPEELLQSMNITPNEPKAIESVTQAINNKVFISHGNNKKVVDQLKQLLEFGAFTPIVSVDRETTAIPVPDKVFNDMRQCFAGIIHIEGERKLLDQEGTEYNLINENVLIEIGAAIALFKNKVILLCKKETKLPSNLQGLYRCEYEGEQLDYDATMKLLKAFSEFRKI